MKELERVLKALANRRRLAILAYLKRNREAAVAEIADEINLSFKATSKHLGILTGVDIVDKEQRSAQVFYRLASGQKPSARHILSLL
ncbi:MAG: winged helix-turn-helix transcriptional regulator [Candidatus Liptonbacteria bacterium]|nr:winged helix-turn-helix transcriptional regulator [Candidatus Liptonbacteria bacterium]